MRLHSIVWFGVAAVAVAMVVGTWSLSAAAHPGEAVPDSIADNLRGGACDTATVLDGKCVDTTEVMYCDKDKKMKCVAGAFATGTGDGTTWEKKGANFCCGLSKTSCQPVTPDYKKCGSGPIAIAVP